MGVTLLDCNPSGDLVCSQSFDSNKPECAWCLSNSYCQSRLACALPLFNSTECPSTYPVAFHLYLGFTISPSSSSSGNLSVPIQISGGFFIGATYTMLITGNFHYLL